MPIVVIKFEFYGNSHFPLIGIFTFTGDQKNPSPFISLGDLYSIKCHNLLFNVSMY